MTNLQRYWLSLPPLPFPQPPSDALQLSISPRREKSLLAGRRRMCTLKERVFVFHFAACQSTAYRFPMQGMPMLLLLLLLALRNSTDLQRNNYKTMGKIASCSTQVSLGTKSFNNFLYVIQSVDRETDRSRTMKCQWPTGGSIDTYCPRRRPVSVHRHPCTTHRDPPTPWPCI